MTKTLILLLFLSTVVFPNTIENRKLKDITKNDSYSIFSVTGVVSSIDSGRSISLFDKSETAKINMRLLPKSSRLLITNKFKVGDELSLFAQVSPPNKKNEINLEPIQIKTNDQKVISIFTCDGNTKSHGDISESLKLAVENTSINLQKNRRESGLLLLFSSILGVSGIAIAKNTNNLGAAYIGITSSVIVAPTLSIASLINVKAIKRDKRRLKSLRNKLSQM